MPSVCIAIAVSGGVDSLVAAYLLKQQYRNVFGIHFVTGYEKHPMDTKRLEKQLNIPVTCIDLKTEFQHQVIDYLVKTYLDGKTPNPCLICNRTIKFGALLKRAKQMGADVLATGHYATVVNHYSFPGRPDEPAYIKKGHDRIKDQSYFLSWLSHEQLSHILFPLSGMTKDQVRALAASKNLVPTQPSESQDICFVHGRKLSQFITDHQQIQPAPGHIIDMDGKIIGRHTGLHQFTIGQRRGINCPSSEPFYVKSIDPGTNTLQVCFKKDLTCSRFTVYPVHWNYPVAAPVDEMTVKIRYSHPQVPARLIMEDQVGIVTLQEPQNAVTPGQAAVFYRKDRLLGAGIIQ